MRRVFSAVGLAILVGLAGCERLRGAADDTPGSPGERSQSRCRQGCGDTYQACLRDCKDDAPQACETRCDLRQKKCLDGCSGE